MSDIRFNQWLHNSGTGGVAQDSTGHVGIGTTVPTHPNALTHNNSILAVGIVSCKILNASTTIEGFIDDWIQHTGDTDTKFGFPTDNTFEVHTGGSPRIKIDANGDVVIGATSLTGADTLEVVDSSNNQFRLTRPGTQNYQFGIVSGGHLYISGSSNGEIIRFQSDKSTILKGKVYADSSTRVTGNVGVQTTTVEGTDLVGAGTSFFGAYIGDGMLAFHNRLDNSTGYYVAPHVNALNAGPITLASTMTLDGTWVII